jgi:hypothetical protein
VAHTKRSSAPLLDARADMVSLHRMGPRTSPTQRCAWLCIEVASDRMAVCIDARR